MSAGDQRTVGPIAPKQPLQRASSGTRRANPRDHTGRQKQILEEQRAAEQARAAAADAEAAEREAQLREDVVIDYSKGGTSSPGMLPVDEVPALVEEEIEVKPLEVTIRVNAPIEDMVFGRKIEDPGDPENDRAPILGSLQFYNFEEGRSYKVPTALAEHLDRIGYLYH